MGSSILKYSERERARERKETGREEGDIVKAGSNHCELCLLAFAHVYVCLCIYRMCGSAKHLAYKR